MKNEIWGLLAIAILILGCGSTPVAPRSADGSPIHVAVLVDAGYDQVKDQNPELLNQRKQLEDYIKSDLSLQFKEAGYGIRFISDSAQYTGEGGEYLLLYRVTHYFAGSKAARVLVGFGAGSASMATQCDLYNGSQKVLDKKQQINTSRAKWQHIVDKTDLVLLREMVNVTK